MLILHKLDLKVLVRLIMVCENVIDAFEKRGGCFWVVLPLKQKLLFGTNLNKVDQPITWLARQTLRVRSNICYYSYDWFVDRSQQTWAWVNQFEHWNENKVGVAANSFLKRRHIKRNFKSERLVQTHSKLSAAWHRQQHENAKVHQVWSCWVLFRLVKCYQDSNDHDRVEIVSLREVLKQILQKAVRDRGGRLTWLVVSMRQKRTNTSWWKGTYVMLPG